MLSLACWLWLQVCPLGQSGKSHIQPQDIHGSKGAIFSCASFLGIRNPFLSRKSTNKTWLVPLCEGCHIPIPQTNHCKDFPRTNGGESESVSHSVVSNSVTPWTVACQVPLPMEFSRQEYWHGLPFLSPGDLSDPGIEPGSPALQILYCLSHQGSPYGGESPTKMPTLNSGEKSTNQLDKI